MSTHFDDASLWHDIKHNKGLLANTTQMPQYQPKAKAVFDQWVEKMNDGRLQDYNPGAPANEKTPLHWSA